MRYFIANYSTVMVPESDFDNLPLLVEKLNLYGFNLGSGHESLEIEKLDKDYYILHCLCYCGGPEHSITFELVDQVKIKDY